MYEVLIAHLRECAKLDPSNNTYAEAADAIETLEHHVFLADLACKAEAAKAPRWIPVTERLPENGKYVLAYSADDDYMTVEARHKFETFQITHWMPLPKGPEEET